MSHNYVIGQLVNFFTDNWVEVGPGHEKNMHKPVNGFVSHIDIIQCEPDDPSGYYVDVIHLKGGGVYQRSCYYDRNSPYGWVKIAN
jgi:hypothetical protein